MRWNYDDALLSGLGAETLIGWAAEAPVALIQLPPVDGSRAVGVCAGVAPSSKDGPLDTLVGTETVGKGMLILCQLPVSDWDDDPRARILMHNLLACAAAGPEPRHPPACDPPDYRPKPSDRNLLVPCGAPS